ncbi:SDR family oxidoreductase [Actinomadura opuntiae]|uniref:SDR family oxidoreductase n=1 Tax=Actinomadura sp. OS1-43 TaxID=604315 RepID=UPI00255AE793|nr:SDR family oxidoreductase [Actinomadura sp. OS1-43]MDL4813391.1 SDR family oxidoreductase [Actinomadura sp. OS1-43]
MTKNLSGKAAVVTGASRGIGRAIALGLAARGASVAVNYLKNGDLAAEVVASIEAEGGTAVALQADLSRPAEVAGLFDRAEQAFGGLDIVFANAADAVVKPLIECTEEDYDRLFAANVKSVFFTLQEAARRVRDGGRIVATSTGGTKMFFTETSLYLGSKGAVEQFVRVLSRELGPRNVTVNALSPGFTDTDLLPDRDREVAAGMSPFGRVGQPQDVADVAVFLAGDEARWITGQNIAAGGGVF